MKDRINKIISDLDSVCVDNKLNISDECLLVQACSFYRGEKAGEKFNSKASVTKEVDKSIDPKLATEKQKQYIYSNNLDANTQTLTKAEAFEIIKEHKEKPSTEAAEI